jgi:hypothetical protein
MELSLEWFEEPLFSAKLKEQFLLSASSGPKKLSSNLTH